ncbi:MAG TPA: HAD family hydrolase [Candidatus Acidoferrum sp.]|nr:HAD family hydrolase [Candidatus Acidoferrum sp.]
MKKAAFLDRDGVINQKAPDGEYVTRWEDFRLLPGAIEGIAQLNRAGFSVIIVTNQRCVARGLLTEEELGALHQRMTDELARGGATIDAVYYCPHELEPPCRCRKPEPGMLLEASQSRNLDLAGSWMIGDSDCDIQAGKNAGCRTARLSDKDFLATKSKNEGATTVEADVVASSLLEAIPQILCFGRP